jgi:hypothetical protein
MFSEFTSTNGIPVTGFEISSSNTRCPDGVLPLPRDYQQTKDLKSPTGKVSCLIIYHGDVGTPSISVCLFPHDDEELSFRKPLYKTASKVKI